MDQPDGGEGPTPSTPGPDTLTPRLPAGRYRLDEKIGEGGFAEVWKGYDLELRRAVAVKMPKAGRLATGDRVERFVAEARRVAGLKHPGVVPVFDVLRDGDDCFIVSEFVEGGSLADRITKDRPANQEAIRLVAEAAETLAYAHRQGFVHRDIKPGNILIDHHGRALLADFGIARAPDDATESGSFGTLAYMSPEQVQGQPADHRADIYSLGVVLYELFTGHLPHPAQDPVELRRQIVAGTAARIPAVPKQLGRICLKCLARNLADRYQDAATLAAGPRRAAGSSPRSQRLVVGAAGLLLLAAVVGGVVFFQGQRQGTEQPSDPGIGTKDSGGQRPAPASVEASLALGKLHFGRKGWAKAEVAFTEAIRLNPESAEAYHRRAGSRFNAGKVKESLPDFDVAARLDPKNAEVFKNRGIAYLNLLRFDEALADLRHALELDPDHPEPYRKMLSATYARRGEERGRAKKWKEAIADMDEAIRFDPLNAGYFDRRGSCRYNLRQFEEARKDFTEAIRLDPKQHAYYLPRGFAHEALGRKAEAAEDYRKGKQSPDPE